MCFLSSELEKPERHPVFFNGIFVFSSKEKAAGRPGSLDAPDSGSDRNKHK